MEITFGVISTLTLEYKPGADRSKLVDSKFNLFIDDDANKLSGSHGKINPDAYFDKEGLPTADGCRSITEILVTSLSANIHASHQKGFRDSAEHLRYVIKELERHFVAVVDIEKDVFPG